MIPVARQSEPGNFDELVRTPGKAFLEKVPLPSDKQFKPHAYWTRVLKQIRKDYAGICAYSALWIPPATGFGSIDHFIPKSRDPWLAYEWDNYRYAALRFNNKKGTKEILDPFTLKPDWFVMDFPSLAIMPNPALSPIHQAALNETIEILRLDTDEEYIDACKAWIMEYCSRDISFNNLERKAPFIAYELKRQNLVEKIREIMIFPGSILKSESLS
jgi:hypothetical protein